MWYNKSNVILFSPKWYFRVFMLLKASKEKIRKNYYNFSLMLIFVNFCCFLSLSRTERRVCASSYHHMWRSFWSHWQKPKKILCNMPLLPRICTFGIGLHRVSFRFSHPLAHSSLRLLPASSSSCRLPTIPQYRSVSTDERIKQLEQKCSSDPEHFKKTAPSQVRFFRKQVRDKQRCVPKRMSRTRRKRKRRKRTRGRGRRKESMSSRI